VSEDPDLAGAPEELPRGPSAVLVEAREKLGFSQKDVADRLFLTTAYIKYIDDGELDRIPKQAFVRGYLRSYARAVDLSGDMIVELYEKEQQLAAPEPEIKGVTEEKVGTAHITGPVLTTGAIGFGLLLLLIGLIWWLVSDDEPVSSVRVAQPSVAGPERAQKEPAAYDYVDDPVVTDEQETIDGNDPQVELPVEALPGGLETLEVSASETLPMSAIDSETGSAGIEEIEESVEPPAQEPESGLTVDEESVSGETDESAISIERSFDGELNYITVDAGGVAELTMTFTDECWVEVSDGQHGTVYYDLNRKDDVLTVYGTLAFEILLGKATGVEMLYNGAPFDLEPYIGPDETAKISISD